MNLSNLCTMMTRRCCISSKRVAVFETSKVSFVSSSCYSTISRSIASKSIAQSKTLSFPGYSPMSMISSSFSSVSFNPFSRLNNLNPIIHSVITPSPSIISIQSRTMASKKHKRIIKMAKGYRGRAKNTFRAAIRRVEKGLQYAYRDRKTKKRNFRKLWIERINAGVRQHDMNYSRFIQGLDLESAENGGQGIMLNRKVMADLAANEPFSFKAIVDVVKARNESR